MRKTLQDLASYLKTILVPETHEAYAVQPIFETVATAENIRTGVLAFRAFLCRLYDAVIAEGSAYDNRAKVAHEYENRTTLSVYYPFLHNLKTLLMNIGYHGVLAADGASLACANTIFDERLPISKTLECLRFLADCGIRVEGMDTNQRKQNLSDIQAITITYPENPAMLTGLKVMALAEIDHGTLVNQDVFLRCDYRALTPEVTDVLSIVQDTIKPLSAEIQKFILYLHRRYLAQGLTCVVEIKGFWIYIKYCYKRKDVWGINASLSNGRHINVKPAKTQEYADAIQTFSPFLQELIAKGYGCGRKREVGHCDGGCRGLSIPLDASVVGMQDDIVRWFDRELLCLRGK